jgi:ABC-2 type transport system ATP-binding protein
VFLSSHLLAEVGQVCDEVAVIHAGRLIEQGPVGQLASARPRLRLVVDPADQPAALALLRRWPARADGPGAVLVEAAGREVNEVLGRGGIWASQILPERAGLEEAFLRLTETRENGDATARR